MGAVLASRATCHLGIVEVGVHVRVRVKEPGVEVGDNTLRVDSGTSNAPRQRIVQDGVCQVVKVADVVDETGIGVERTIHVVVVTGLEH